MAGALGTLGVLLEVSLKVLPMAPAEAAALLVTDAEWAVARRLLDYGDIVVHVQHEEERQFYALERLWRDCPVIAIPDAGPPAAPVEE